MMVSSSPNSNTLSSQVKGNASSLSSVPIVADLPQENETVSPQTIDLGPSEGDSKKRFKKTWSSSKM